MNDHHVGPRERRRRRAVVFAVLVSLIISFTLTPMMSSRYLKPHGQESPGPRSKPLRRVFRLIQGMGNWLERRYDEMEKVYRRFLAWCLDRRITVLVVATVIIVLSLIMTRFIGKEFVPPEDQSQFIVRLEAPIDYSVDSTDQIFRKAEAVVKEIPEITRLYYSQGGGRFREVNKAVFMITLKPKKERKRSQQDIQALIRKDLARIPGLKASAENISLIGGGQRSVPTQYSIRGTDLDALQRYARQITGDFAKLPGIVDVDTSLESGKPEVKVYIDRDKAGDLGVDVKTIASSINTLIGGKEVSQFRTGGNSYDVRVRLVPEERSMFQDIDSLLVRNSAAEHLRLSNVALPLA